MGSVEQMGGPGNWELKPPPLGTGPGALHVTSPPLTPAQKGRGGQWTAGRGGEWSGGDAHGCGRPPRRCWGAFGRPPPALCSPMVVGAKLCLPPPIRRGGGGELGAEGRGGD